MEGKLMSQTERVVNFLKIRDKEGASALEMGKILNISCPYSVVRDIRDSAKLKKKYGIEDITDEWRTKTRIEYNGQGKEYKVTTRYKAYFVKKLEGV
jgi:hypothetical protein